MKSKLLILTFVSIFSLSLTAFTAEYSSSQKVKGLAMLLSKTALKNSVVVSSDGFTFSQVNIGKIAYYLDYYLFTPEDISKTSDYFSREVVQVSEKNLDDIFFLLQNFLEVSRIMRQHQIGNINLLCHFLYGKIQDHALLISPVIQQSFKDRDTKFEPAFVGGCWYSNHYPSKLFPNYLE